MYLKITESHFFTLSRTFCLFQFRRIFKNKSTKNSYTPPKKTIFWGRHFFENSFLAYSFFVAEDIPADLKAAYNSGFKKKIQYPPFSRRTIFSPLEGNFSKFFDTKIRNHKGGKKRLSISTLGFRSLYKNARTMCSFKNPAPYFIPTGILYMYQQIIQKF